MTSLFDAFLADVVNDSIDANPGPMNWAATNRALGQQKPTVRLYTGTEDDDDALEARETRMRLGAHQDEGTGSTETVATTKTADKVTAGDTILIRRVAHFVDTVTTDNSHVADHNGFVNLELLRINPDGSHGTRSYHRFPWHQTLTMGAGR